MILTYDVLSTVFKAINVASVTDNISGKVYIGPEPNNDQLENITIGMLANPGQYVQDGIINLNASAMGVRNGRPDLAALDKMCKLLKPLIDDTVIGGGPGGPTMHVTIDDDKGPFKDQDADGKFFQNIRLNFVTL